MSRVRSREPDTSSLPRWVREPMASDFAGAQRLRFEATSGSQADGLAGWSRPRDRFEHALDLTYGPGRWPAGRGRYPGWPGRWMPGREFDPASYEPLLDGPPRELREAVDRWQAAQDQAMREMLLRNGWGCDPAILARHGIPPAGQEPTFGRYLQG